MKLIADPTYPQQIIIMRQIKSEEVLLIEGYYIPSPSPEGRHINNFIRVIERAFFHGDLPSEEAAINLIHECTGCCTPESVKARYGMIGNAVMNGSAVKCCDPTSEELELEQRFFARP